MIQQISDLSWQAEARTDETRQSVRGIKRIIPFEIIQVTEHQQVQHSVSDDYAGFLAMLK